MLQRCVEAGLDAAINPPEVAIKNGELIAEIAALDVRLERIEQLLDRSLFTACAAYCYARSAALRTGGGDEEITADVHAAYARQQSLAAGAK